MSLNADEKGRKLRRFAFVLSLTALLSVAVFTASLALASPPVNQGIGQIADGGAAGKTLGEAVSVRTEPAGGTEPSSLADCAWWTVPSPNQGTNGNYLNSVDAVSANDVSSNRLANFSLANFNSGQCD